MRESNTSAYILMASGIVFSCLSLMLPAQVRVNGVVQGDLWRTSKVSGSVEVMHGWGRTFTMPVKSAWVNIRGGHVAIGALCDDPIIDGAPRQGYFMPDMSGPLNTDFPHEHMQTITDTEILTVEEDKEIRVMKTAMISMKDGAPESLVFTCVEYASFDVEAFVKELLERNSIMDAREAEALKGFDSMGFRTTSFYAVFDKNSKTAD